MQNESTLSWRHILSTTLGFSLNGLNKKIHKPSPRQFFTALEEAMRHLKKARRQNEHEPIYRITVAGKLRPYQPTVFVETTENSKDFSTSLHQLFNKSLQFLQNPSFQLVDNISKNDPRELMNFLQGQSPNIAILSLFLRSGVSLVRHIPNFVSLFRAFQAMTVEFEQFRKTERFHLEDLTSTLYLVKTISLYTDFCREHLLNKARKHYHKGVAPALVEQINEKLSHSLLLLSTLTEHINIEEFQNKLFSVITYELKRREAKAEEELLRIGDSADDYDVEFLPFVVNRYDEIVRAYHHLGLLFPDLFGQRCQSKIAEITTKLTTLPVCQIHQVEITCIASNWEQPLWPVQQNETLIRKFMIEDVETASPEQTISNPVFQETARAETKLISQNLSHIIESVRNLAKQVRRNERTFRLYEEKLAQHWEPLLDNLTAKYQWIMADAHNVEAALEDTQFLQSWFALQQALSINSYELPRGMYKQVAGELCRNIEQYQLLYTTLMQREINVREQRKKQWEPMSNESETRLDTPTLSQDDESSKRASTLSSYYIEYLLTEENDVSTLFDSIINGLRPDEEHNKLRLFAHSKTDIYYKATIEDKLSKLFLENEDNDFVESLAQYIEHHSDIGHSVIAKNNTMARDMTMRNCILRTLLSDAIKHSLNAHGVRLSQVLISPSGKSVTFIVPKSQQAHFKSIYTEPAEPKTSRKRNSQFLDELTPQLPNKTRAFCL